MRLGGVTFNQRVDFLLAQQRENLDVSGCVLVGAVHPELIESVRRGFFRVEPDVAFLGLAELTAVGLGDEVACEGEGLLVGAEFAADEFRAGGDVAPLVGAAHLQLTAFMFKQIEEVVALNELVAELGERHSVAFAVETFLHRVLGHHVVDGDVFADVADEMQECVVFHPVIIVDEFGAVRLVAVEVEELCELFLDAGLVML